MPRLLGGAQQPLPAGPSDGTIAERDEQQIRPASLPQPAAVQQGSLPRRSSMEPACSSGGAAAAKPAAGGRAGYELLRRLKSGRAASSSGCEGAASAAVAAPPGRRWQVLPARAGKGSGSAARLQGKDGRMGSWDNDAGSVIGRGLGNDAPGSGSEWDVVTASLDDSGSGHDVAAGLGVQPALLSLGRGRKRRPLLRLPGMPGPGSADEGNDERRQERLAPRWPLSLHPLSYRRNAAAERGAAAAAVEAEPVQEQEQLEQAAAASVGDSADASSSVSASSEEAALAEVEHGGLQPLLTAESLDDSSDGADEGGSGMAVTLAATLLEERVAAEAGQVAFVSPEKGTQLQAGAAVNNAVPARRVSGGAAPLQRLRSMQQTAAAAGRVMLGASRLGAQVCAALTPLGSSVLSNSRQCPAA